MAKKHKCPEFENHERWLVAGYDMMTLLFALFVVLYAQAMTDKDNAKAVAESIAKSFGNPTAEADPNSVEDAPPSGNSRRQGIFDKIRGDTNRESVMTRNRRERAAIIAADAAALEKMIEERLYGSENFPKSELDRKDRVVFVSRDPDGIRVTLLARKFFKPSDTVIENEAKRALDAVAVSIKGLGKMIRVEGHTDNLPFNFKGMSNWELSAGRAAAVVRYFISEHRFDNRTIYPAGFADTRPIAPNDTPQNRGLNRRVDLKLLYETPQDYVAPQIDRATPPEADED